MTTLQRQSEHLRIIQYYEEAGPDYSEWSPAFNMHFGYFRWGRSPFRLEPMLNRMNGEIFRRLGLDNTPLPLVLDAGCGLAATSRYMAGLRPDAHFYGVTISPWQIEFGQKLNEEAGMEERISLLCTDYHSLPLSAESFDAAFAIESSCYGRGKDKRLFLTEMARVLRPGGRFVLSDGFRKSSKPLPGWLDKIYRRNMECWALEDLADIGSFISAMKSAGFVNIKVEDVSWRVAPSFLHIPLTTIRYFWKRFRDPDRIPLKQSQKNNVLAPLLGMLMGLARPYFGYYIVTGEKQH